MRKARHRVLGAAQLLGDSLPDGPDPSSNKDAHAHLAPAVGSSSASATRMPSGPRT